MNTGNTLPKCYVPSGRLYEYLSLVFIRNNGDSLEQLIRVTAEKLDLRENEYHMEDILDRVAYAVSVDFCHGRLVDSGETVADICRRRSESILGSIMERDGEDTEPSWMYIDGVLVNRMEDEA